MKILATRVSTPDAAPDAAPDIHTYKVENGGGILKTGGKIKVTYKADRDRTDADGTGLPVRTSPVPVSLERRRQAVRIGFNIGPSARATVPIASEGLGIPYVGELVLGGTTAFKGHFDADVISLENTGVTNPSVDARRAELEALLREVHNASRGSVESIEVETTKDYGLHASVHYTAIYVKV